MRELKIGTNRHTTVAAVDEPGHGGANHHYEVLRVVPEPEGSEPQNVLEVILFQNGPVKECGVNGIHNEDLLCILIDRLEGFQRGEHASIENYHALNNLKAALAHLAARTKRRIGAGVEGTSRPDENKEPVPSLEVGEIKEAPTHERKFKPECFNCNHSEDGDKKKDCEQKDCVSYPPFIVIPITAESAPENLGVMGSDSPKVPAGNTVQEPETDLTPDGAKSYKLSGDKLGLMVSIAGGPTYHIHSNEMSEEEVLVHAELLKADTPEENIAPILRQAKEEQADEVG